MNTLFQNILTASFHGSIVILAVLALRLVLKKTPKKFLCLLWLLALLRLLMPFEIKSDFSLQPEYNPTVRVQWQQLQEPGAVPGPGAPAAMPGNAPSAVAPQASAQVQASAQTPTVQVETRREVNWFSMLPWLWAGVASLFLVYTVYSYVRLRLQVRESVKIPGGWECDRIETAFILGFIKPKIYIPMGLSRMVRKHILAHERTHLEKGDHWYKMIGFIALALHWFNPLVWVAYILLCKDIEMACDERVVQFMELQERKEYSAALLNCSTNRTHLAACPVAFGEVSVKHRIKSVLKYKKPGFWISLAGVLAIAFVAICLVTSPTGENKADVVPEATETLPETNPLIDTPLSDVFMLNFIQTLQAGEVESIEFWNAELENGYTHIQERQRISEIMDFLHTSNGEFLPEAHVANINSRVYYLHLTNGKTATIGVYGDELMAIGKALFKTSREWTNAFPVEGEEKVPEDFDEIQMAYDRISTPDEERSGIVWHQDGVLPEETPMTYTAEEELLKSWGVDFLVEDDRLTRSGSDIWYIQQGLGTGKITTTDEYWLEKKTDTGWEKLPMIVEKTWPEASYNVTKSDRYNSVYINWAELYGDLPGGEYRMGKWFARVDDANRDGTPVAAYAEFTIFDNPSTTAQQEAALNKCFAAVEDFRNWGHWHIKVNSFGDHQEEFMANGGSKQFSLRTYGNEMGWEGGPFDKTKGGTMGYIVWESIAYDMVHESPRDLTTPVIGWEFDTLATHRAGYVLDIDFEAGLSFYERKNCQYVFPEASSKISDREVIFFESYTDATSGEVDMYRKTYRFDENGKLAYLEYESEDFHGNPIYHTVEILSTSPQEIDAIIQAQVANLIVTRTFSWEEAKAEYTDDKYNIKESGFINNDVTTIANAAEAALRAKKEYPNLTEFIDNAVAYDETAKMWRVTFEGYVDYQRTYEYRDVYLDENGVTHLMVYEGPVEEREE